jgi:hypothetical protein
MNMLINDNDNSTERIKEIKQQIENVENQRELLRKFYTENKDKENDYELVKTFFDNTIFIQKITTDVFSCFINDKNDNYETFLRHYKHSCDYPTVVGFDQKGKENLKLICDDEEMKLNFKIVLLKHKLEYYENLKCEKPEIKNIEELNPEKQHYSVPASVIFLIMIMFAVIAVTTVVLMVNHDYNTDINIMLHHMQCIRLIDKHNKLKDAF